MDAKACKKSEYRDSITRRCRKTPTKLKGWEAEPHRFLTSEIDFWRNRPGRGFISVHKVEYGAPAWELGKHQVQINTQQHLDTRYFDEVEDAKGFAVGWMEKHPIG